MRNEEIGRTLLAIRQNPEPFRKWLDEPMTKRVLEIARMRARLPLRVPEMLTLSVEQAAMNFTGPACANALLDFIETIDVSNEKAVDDIYETWGVPGEEAGK